MCIFCKIGHTVTLWVWAKDKNLQWKYIFLFTAFLAFGPGAGKKPTWPAETDSFTQNLTHSTWEEFLLFYTTLQLQWSLVVEGPLS